MTPDIINAVYIDGYKIRISFDNGREGIVDFTKYITKGGVFSKLKDIELFKKFTIDPEVFVLTWPGRIDIAPEEIYSEATGESLPSWMSDQDEAKKVN
jgi:hypothetical protein